MTPLGCAFGAYPSAISIPKLLLDAQGERLSFPDVLASEASQFNTAPEFKALGLTHVDNTPAEIAEIAEEMLDRLEGRAGTEAEDEALQATFKGAIRPHHLAWPGAARIGRDFLQRHRLLLQSGGRTDFALPAVEERRD